MVRTLILLPSPRQDVNRPRQVHADASNFAAGVTKDEAYEQVLLQAEGLFYEQRNWVRTPLPKNPSIVS